MHGFQSCVAGALGLPSNAMPNLYFSRRFIAVPHHWKLTWALLAAISMVSPAGASDYAREKRFADEVTAQLVVGDAVMVSPPAGAPASYRPFLGLYAAGKPGMPAVVLAHGVGTHPDDGLTGSLRLRLNDLGYTTLAIQMPIAAKDATVDDYFPALFPEAGARLQAASGWLKSKGHRQVALVSHTMGSWMANVYLDQQAPGKGARDGTLNGAYQAWACISLTGGYSFAVRTYPFPVLDLYGENDIPVTVSSAWRRNGLLRLAAAGSRQQMVPGADAQWRGKEQAAAQAVADFFRSVLP
jgi:hypothetical protein